MDCFAFDPCTKFSAETASGDKIDRPPDQVFEEELQVKVAVEAGRGLELDQQIDVTRSGERVARGRAEDRQGFHGVSAPQRLSLPTEPRQQFSLTHRVPPDVARTRPSRPSVRGR